MAASRRFCFLLIFLIGDAGLILCQSVEGPMGPDNVTIVPHTRSLVVSWDPPKNMVQEDKVESYRVRLHPANMESLKRVHWVPNDGRMQETVSCLEPSTTYKVQVFARFFKGSSNQTDISSEVFDATTTPEPNFLQMAVHQWRYVALGAGLASLLFLILAGCVWCCCCRIKCRGKRRHMKVTSRAANKIVTKTEKSKKGKGVTNLPSAKELQERERRRLENENRYSLDPVQSGTAWSPSPSDTSTTNSRAHLVRNGLNPGRDELPPFLQAGPLSPSFPRNMAPSRPPLPWPKSSENMEDDVFNDDDAPIDDIYANQDSFPPPEGDCHLYGNCQF
eukprot:GHVL01037791.1.p1 GENE.GHVL01037791.1~~GHVL01037791.1.p1  ORF type:complete len:334 (+),score=12.86 GHVL01037791.1:174-1175(+)